MDAVVGGTLVVMVKDTSCPRRTLVDKEHAEEAVPRRHADTSRADLHIISLIYVPAKDVVPSRSLRWLLVVVLTVAK